MLSKIFLNANFSKYIPIEGGHVLKELNKVNIFIGENNSGKSRFLRTLFNFDKYTVEYTDFSFKEYNIIVEKAIEELKDVLRETRASDFQLLTSHNRMKTIDYMRNFLIKRYVGFNNLIQLKSELESFINNIGPFNIDGIIRDTGRVDIDTLIDPNFRWRLEQIINKMTANLKEKVSSITDIKHSKLYIPVLRGLRPLYLNKSDSTNTTFDNDDVYHSRTVKDYFHSKSENINYKDLNADNNYKSISTGLDLYEDVRKHLLNNVEHRKLIREFEEFIGDTFFKGASISLIPHHEDDSLWIGINDDEKPIYHLGDGIQALIIMLYPLFKNRGKNMLFFIEEPETHLHPGMQRIFLEALQDPRFSTFQYFITTHSNHFLDITLDMSNISIYTFKKKEQSYYIENVSNADNNVLELIGVRNSSVFLSNCTIWVEGITDRLYIKKYLDVYQREVSGTKYLEDIHYSFVEYGGNNIEHWSFLDDDNNDDAQRINVDRICSKLFLITDSDGADDDSKQWKTERFKLLKKNLGNRYYKLNAREIENTLPKHIIKKYIQNREKNNDKLDFSEFDKHDYKQTLLGDYIEANVKNKLYKYREKKSSGTIGDKITFCKRTTELIETRDDLTNEAKLICKKLVEFIESNNK